MKSSKEKNEKRLGGKALSLQSFANAKSMSSGYNPSIIKKQREFYRNAKYVSKFKKSVKREHQPAQLVDINEDGTEKRTKAKKKKNMSNLRAIKEEVEKKRAEVERAKMEREAMFKVRNEERAKAEARRKAQREKMLKKTRSGQPVMKYRIEHLLQGLIKDSTN